MIAYYEAQAGNLPARLLPPLSQALRVSPDALLGLKPLKVKAPEESLRFLKKLKRIASLPRRKRERVLHYAESLLRKRKTN